MKNLYHKISALLTAALLANFASATTVTVTGNDTMRFDTTAIEATVGEEITIEFKNAGTLPKQAMGHNLVVLKPSADLAAFGNGAAVSGANDYIPTAPELVDLVIAHTKMLGPNESDTITVTFDAPGEYPFICSFPGHWALMRGIITVK